MPHSLFLPGSEGMSSFTRASSRLSTSERCSSNVGGGPGGGGGRMGGSSGSGRGRRGGGGGPPEGISRRGPVGPVLYPVPPDSAPDASPRPRRG
jgi:hypothetical protein